MDELSHRVFISYARPDRDHAGELYDWLKKNGFEPWVDYKDIKAGQNWDYEIKVSLNKSTIIILLWSANDISRRGYIQREIKIALDKYAEKLVDDIFIIPVIIDDTKELPQPLQQIQYISASDQPNWKDQVADSIYHQIERLGGQRKEIQTKQDVYWKAGLLSESWDGLPGYSVQIQTLDFWSDRYSDVRQISQFVNGDMLDALFTARKNKLGPSADFHNFAQDHWARTDTYDAHCGEPTVTNKVLSINYAVSWYGAGAAHPSHGIKTFVFLLEPLIRIASLSQVFLKPKTAFPVVQRLVRESLIALRPWQDEESGGVDGGLDEDWVNKGTASWNDFSAFVFAEKSIDIFFGSYQVAPYAAGTPHASVPYDAVAKLMRPEYVTALNIQRYTYDL